MTFNTLVGRAISILEPLASIIIGLALILFLWGIVKYLTHYGDEEQRHESVKYITWGLFGLFVMVSLWGLVVFFADSLGFSGGINIPQLTI